MTEKDAIAKVRAWRREATEDPEGFWGRAAEQVPWFRKWERVLDWQPPTFRWYSGGLSNLAYNCVDHHVAAGRGDHVALITENERGERRTLTYADLHRETKRVGAALRAMGIAKGDRIAIYMPTSAEAIVLLDTEPEKAFGFKLRTGADRPDAHGKLLALRDAFDNNRRVRLEFLRTGCRTGQIVRVISQH